MTAFVLTDAQQHRVERAVVPVPTAGPREILVRIRAVGVGIHDSYFLPPGISYPFPIGIEAAGVVEAVGEAVDGILPGARIAFVSSMQVKGGTWAQYAVVSADALILPIPDALSFEQAAAVPVAGNTAVKTMRLLEDLPEQGSLFVAGASGAIGTFLVQMAKAQGWTVAASASPRNHEYLHSLGADMVVDYHDGTWQDQVLSWATGGVDAAVAIQPGTTADCVRIVRDHGLAVTVSGDRVAGSRGVGVMMPPHDVDVTAETGSLLRQIADGSMTLTIENVFPFDDGLQALAKVQTRRARGKTVLSLP